MPHLLLWGNAYAQIIRNGKGEVVALYPLMPNRMVVDRDENGHLYARACVHGFIDGNDGTIYQTLPWNHRGWHGGGSSNNTHIGVEMCEPACIKYTGGATFTCSDTATAKAVAKRTYEAAKIEPLMPALPTRKKVAAYARVSMESERLQHSLSARSATTVN